MRQTSIYCGNDDDRIAECPTLPGGTSRGSPRQETIEKFRDAITLPNRSLAAENIPLSKDCFEANWSRVD